MGVTAAAEVVEPVEPARAVMGATVVVTWIVWARPVGMTVAVAVVGPVVLAKAVTVATVAASWIVWVRPVGMTVVVVVVDIAVGSLSARAVNASH